MSLRKMDLQLLVVFAAVYEDRGVTSVARRLGLSQPAVTFSLNRLRSLVGDELFVRTAAGMLPTARAEALIDPVRDVLRAVETRILASPRFDPATFRYRFTLALSDLGQQVLLPRLIARLEGAAPLVDLDCPPIATEDIAAALESGRADLAVGIAAAARGGNILQQRLFENPYVCIVARDHPAIGTTLSVARFVAAEHAVAASLEEVLRRAVRGAADGLRVRVRSTQFSTLAAIAAGTDLVAVVPQALALSWAGSAAIRILPVPFALPAVGVLQFWHRRLNTDPASMWLRRTMADIFLNRDPTLPPRPD